MHVASAVQHVLCSREEAPQLATTHLRNVGVLSLVNIKLVELAVGRPWEVGWIDAEADRMRKHLRKHRAGARESVLREVRLGSPQRTGGGLRKPVRRVTHPRVERIDPLLAATPGALRRNDHGLVQQLRRD
jgi:hypothetical protein